MSNDSNTTEAAVDAAAQALWQVQPLTRENIHAAARRALEAAAPHMQHSKPRTITTVEELDALPMGAAVLDSRRTVWVNDGDTVAPWASLGEGNYEGGPIWVSSVDIALDVVVLHEPDAEAGA